MAFGTAGILCSNWHGLHPSSWRLLELEVEARADPLRLDNLSESSYLEKTNSPSLSRHWLSVTLYLGMGSWEISPTYIGVLPNVVMLRVLFMLYLPSVMCQCAVSYMCVFVSDVCVRMS